MFEFTVWCTTEPLMLALYVGSHVRRLSSAPHCMRVMMVGLATAASAVATGIRPMEPSAALVPPSTKVALRRSIAVVARSERTRTCTASLPVTATGSVATLAALASEVSVSGAESESPTGVHGPHIPSCRVRTVTVTVRAVSRSGNVTPTTSAPSVSRVSVLSTGPASSAVPPAVRRPAPGAG